MYRTRLLGVSGDWGCGSENEVKICFRGAVCTAFALWGESSKMVELYAKELIFTRLGDGKAIEEIGPRNFIADGSINGSRLVLNNYIVPGGI